MVMVGIDKERDEIRIVNVASPRDAIHNLFRLGIVTPKRNEQVVAIVGDVDDGFVGRGAAAPRFQLDEPGDGRCRIPSGVI